MNGLDGGLSKISMNLKKIKIIILNIFRIICLVPFVMIVIWAIRNSILGSTFITTKVYGLEALILSIVAGVVTMWWIFLICAMLFVVFTVIIEKEKNK